MADVARAPPRYTPVSKGSVADVDDENDGAAALMSSRSSRARSDDDVSAADEELREEGGLKGCDCLTGLIARVRASAGRQRGYAAPGEEVTAPLTHADQEGSGESDGDAEDQRAGGSSSPLTSRPTSPASGEQRNAPSASSNEVHATRQSGVGRVAVSLRKSATGFGMVISPTGTVSSVDLDGPAARAGVTTGTRIVAVEGVPVPGRDEIIRELRRLGDKQEATFTLVDDTRQWPDRSAELELPRTAQPAVPPPRLHPPPHPPSTTAGALRVADTPVRELVVDDASALRTQEALNALVGKEATRFKKTVLQPQDRLVKAGSLNKMGGAESTKRCCNAVLC